MTSASHNLQKKLASAFLVCLALSVPAALVLFGPRETYGEPPEFGRNDTAGMGILPAHDQTWDVGVDAADAAYLVGYFLDCLAARNVGRRAPEAQDPPASCAEATDAPVFVSVYIPGEPRLRTAAREQTVLDSVRTTVDRLLRQVGGLIPAEALRIRIDIMTDARRMPVPQRELFAARGLGEPCGVALQSGEKLSVLLPADIADKRATNHLDLMRLACRDVGLDEAAWSRDQVDIWRIRCRGFLNIGPGGRYVVASDRGLVPMGDATVARLLRSVRTASDYLVGSKEEDGSFRGYWNPATALSLGCQSIVDQAAAAAALGASCSLRPSEETLQACHEAISYVMHYTDADPVNPSRAITRREETCRTVLELEASSEALLALCRYRAASGKTEPDAWILALANFLVSMQREDGLFNTKFDSEERLALLPKRDEDRLVVHAKALEALCAAYAVVPAPNILAAARRGLEAMQGMHVGEDGSVRDYSASEARRLSSAVLEFSALNDAEAYLPWIENVVSQRLPHQLTEGDDPPSDMLGGTLAGFPPKAGQTADDLCAYAAACALGVPEQQRFLDAARRSAVYIMRLQYLPENSYYVSPTVLSTGGIREQVGMNVVSLRTMEAALNGLTMLAQLEQMEAGRHD